MEDFGFVDADAGFGDADLLGNLGVGGFAGDEFEDGAFIFVEIVFDVVPSEVGDVEDPLFAGEFFDVGEDLLFDGVVGFLVFDGVASGDEVFFGSEEVFDGVAGHGGEPVVEFASVAVVFEIFDFLPDFGEDGLGDVFGVFLWDAHAEDEAEDEGAVGGFKFEPGGLVFAGLEALKEGDAGGLEVGVGHGVSVS